MNELAAIQSAWREVIRKGQKAALATIIDVQGASYRKAGARMLITEYGGTTGSISAGCLESDVVARSEKVLQTGRPLILTFDTSGERDAIWGHGLGCNGVITVLLEPLSNDPEELNPLSAAEIASGIHGRCVIATSLVETASGMSCLDNSEDLELHRSLIFESQLNTSDAELDRELLYGARRAFELHRSIMIDIDAGRVFFELINPPLSLVIFGAEHDAIPLVRLAAFLGWQVTVVDVKARKTSGERFYEADQVVLCRTENLENWITSSADAVVMMTHSYLDDVELLKKFLDSPAKYLGILGPRERTENVMSAALDGRLALSGCFAERLHSPIGVDLGAETPEEVALAIMSEITAVNTGANAGFLRDRNGPIHGADELHLNESTFMTGLRKVDDRSLDKSLVPV